jgi:predicted glycosyltransferase
MKILIDIGHPGHVHYFRNLYSIMNSKGHDFLIISREKEVSFELLKYFHIPYKSRGKGRKSLLGKLFYILYADYIIFLNALRFKPDIFLSFSSTYAGHIAFLIRKPHVVLDDTEHAVFEHFMYKPFSDSILTPECFFKDMGKKHIRFNSNFERCYLHPKYYRPDESILISLGLNNNQKYAIIRFVSWDAQHDIGQTGISNDLKIKLVKTISAKIKVFITSESPLPLELEDFKIKISPEKLHDALFYSSLYVGEGATTASESACLGTPAVYVNSLDAGTLQELADNDLLFSFRNETGILEKVVELLNTPKIKKTQTEKAEQHFSSKIDPTAFLVWFLENYPESHKVMKANPEYQYKFK